MPVSIVHQTSSDNKGSCSKYGHYLNKENKELSKEGQGNRQQFFFNQGQNMLTTIQAISIVDDNNKNKGLAKKQDKYFTLTLNFSQNEQEHLASTLAKRPIGNVDELNDKEYEQYNEVIKLFTKQAMRNYADNFKKDIDENQIVWFAKIEHRRRYKGTEKEVMTGKVNSGEPKKGLQTHVHITVSRMHKEYRINLSPLANARNSENLVLNGRKVRGGFDRSNWKQLNEDSFDKMFKYERSLEEKFETLRKLKHGTLEEKRALKTEIRQEKQQNSESYEIDKLIKAQPYFDQDRNTITRASAISIRKDDSKNNEVLKGTDNYFSLTLNLDRYEHEHLASIIAERPIEKVEDLTVQEFEKYNKAIQLFTQQAMRNYAICSKKISTENQLRWYAKVEHEKQSSDDAMEYRISKKEPQKPKENLPIQIHITVSTIQKDHHVENNSLENAEVQDDAMLKKENEMEGFDYSEWIELNQNSFDELFGYERGLKEKKQPQRTPEGLTLEKKLKAKKIVEKEKNQEPQISQKAQKDAEIKKGPNKGRNNQISF